MVDDSQPSSNADSIRARVQSACTSGYSGIVRVTVVGDVGYWYFRRGAIFCAATLDLSGDEAALHMLSWGGLPVGAVQPALAVGAERFSVVGRALPARRRGGAGHGSA